MNTNLSAEALAAVTDANGSTGRVPTTTKPEIVKELKDAGMIAAKNGLTTRGRIVRDRHVTAELDRMFG